MSNSITGVSTARISNQFVRDQLIRQFGSNQTDMFQLETEISTGQQYQLPSENPSSALMVMGIQSLLQRKDQLKTNISTSQTYLGQTDSALSSVSNILTSVRSTALSAVGSTASDSQRQAVVQQVNQAIQQMLTLGNQQISGRQLFGGASATVAPFSLDTAGNVVYSGSSNPVQSYVDLNQLFASSVTGDQAFGAISQPIQGSALTTALSQNTQLSDLNGGQGVAPGSITVFDGHNTSTIDLRNAHTLGDVAALIQQHPPTGRTIKVDVTSTGLTVHLKPDPAYPNGDNLRIQEVNGNTTAHDLGIFNASGAGPGPIVGQSLNADITPITAITDLLASKARAYVRLDQPNSDMILEAKMSGATTTTGTVLNGVTIQFVADAPAAGQETAYYYPGISASGNNPGTPGTLAVHISTSAASASRAGQIVAAINNVSGLPFTASLDPSDQDGGGQPSITTLPATTTTAGGGGTPLDTASGLQIKSGGKTYTIDLSSANTVQDLLNGINDSGAGLVAEINAAKTGINVISRVSGGDFSIGENGGTTAAQLGLRTFTTATQLAQLNHGRGVGRNTGTPGGNDFTIGETLNNPAGATLQVNVSIPTASSVGDVIQSINTAAQTAGATFRAQLATTGNGIELIESGTVAGPLVVTANTQSTAAVDLGLIPAGQTSATSAATATASGIAASDPNSDLVFVETDPATAGNVQIIFQANAGITQGSETVNYDPVAGTLTFQIAPQTTANNIITALHNDPAANAAFTAWPDTTVDPTNNGSGIVLPQQVTTSNGWAVTRPNSELLFQAVNPGTAGNVQVVFQANAGITQGSETVNYDPVAGTLTFQIAPQTTANNIIAALQNDPAAAAAFKVSLATSSDPTNNGNGIVLPQQVATTGGTIALTGSDSNPLETDSIFNALLRLSTALRNNDNPGIQRAMGLLDGSTQNLSNTRAALGASEQSLTIISTQIDNEELTLKSAMSANYDTNMADAISQYTSAQIAYQATLQTTGSLLKMTLLTYL